MERMLHRFVLPSVLTLLSLAVLCAAPSTVVLAETERSCTALTDLDLSAAHTGIRTHHAFPRCPEGEGFTEHHRRKQPVGAAASNPKFVDLARIADGRAHDAPDVPAASTSDGPAVGDVPHSYDPQGPPSDTV